MPHDHVLDRAGQLDNARSVSWIASRDADDRARVAGAARRAAPGGRLCGSESRERAVGGPVVSWDEAHVRDAIASIVADAEAALDGCVWPAHPLDDEISAADQMALYVGTGGMIWALRRLGSSLDLDALAVAALERYPEEAGPDEPASLFARRDRRCSCSRGRTTSGCAALVRANERNPTWEVLYGSPGTILAARAAGLDDEAQRSADILSEEWERHDWGLWDHVLMGHEFQSIGPAHGFAGNVHVLRGVRRRRRRFAVGSSACFARYAVWDGDAVNWPPGPGDPLDRVQWCHGAPGIVSTLGDLMPEDLLLGGAETTWRHGPLEKGPGLCHGTAGNGYALLKTYAVTGDELWLERARVVRDRCARAAAAPLLVYDRRHRRGALRAGVHRRRPAVPDPGRAVTHEVKLSSADRVLFPDDGITKGDLFDYYGRVADALIPHLKDRPFTMKRWREGLPGGSFFQKQAPKGMPDWIETRQFRTWPRGGKGESRLVDFPLVESREALLWMVQMHCIDMNAWYSRVDKPDRPDWVLFDLDPPEEPDAYALCIRVAHLVHDALDALGLASYVKTSGADGIHVLVPITRRSTYADTYEFAELLSRQLEREHPGEVTTEWLKKKRSGVLVDHRQNGHGKTIASVYSVRPKPGAPVSTPLEWEELTEDVRPRDFTMEVALARVAERGDIFEPVLHGSQALGPALKELRG